MPDASRWLVRFLLLFALAFTNLNDIWSPDVLPNALLAWTVLREGNLDYDEFTVPQAASNDRSPDRLDREAYFFRACGQSTATEPPKAARSPGGPPAPGPNDHVCSIFPPGMGFIALPFFAPFVLAGAPPLDLGLLIRVGHVVAALVEVAATLLLWSLMRRFAPARWSFVLVLLYFLATSVRTVASQALWQHAGVHLAIAGALWLVLREEPVPPRREFVSGVLLGLGAVVRQTTALVALGIAGVRPRALALTLAGTALGSLPLFLYNQLAFGAALEQGYGQKPFDTPVAVGLYGLLASPSRGLLLYTPYLAFALAAFVRAWRSPGPVAMRLRSLSLVWLVTLLLYATYAEWWGGRVFGARFIDDQAPILFAALAWAVGSGSLRRRWERVVFAASAAWSFLLFGAAAIVYDQSWDTFPVNVNVDPSRLFDWSNPQWLAVLRALPDGGARALSAALLSALLLALFVRLELRAERTAATMSSGGVR